MPAAFLGWIRGYEHQLALQAVWSRIATSDSVLHVCHLVTSCTRWTGKLGQIEYIGFVKQDSSDDFAIFVIISASPRRSPRCSATTGVASLPPTARLQRLNLIMLVVGDVNGNGEKDLRPDCSAAAKHQQTCAHWSLRCDKSRLELKENLQSTTQRLSTYLTFFALPGLE